MKLCAIILMGTFLSLAIFYAGMALIVIVQSVPVTP